MSFRSSVSPNTNEKHGSHHQSTIHAPEAPHEVYLSTRVSSFACSSSVQSRSIQCAFCFGIWTSGYPLASFNAAPLSIVQALVIWIMGCTASCWACLSAVQIACIKLFTAEYSLSVRCFSITVSSSGSASAPQNSHIVWKHQLYSECKPRIAVTWSLNPILAFIAIYQPTQYFILYRWDLSIIPKPHE